MGERMMSKKKSQITLFIVLGLVVAVIFAFLFFAKKESSGLVLEKKVETIFTDFLRSSSLESVVQACLERATKDALVLAGLQGGKIYDTQVSGGFPLPSPEEVVPLVTAGMLVNVSYGIRSRGIPPENPASFPSTYPDGYGLKESPAADIGPEYASLFARPEDDILNPVSLASLCNYYGPNHYSIANASFSCETYTATNISMQEYLKVFMLNRTKNCINLVHLSGNSQFTIKEGNVEAEVIFGNNDITSIFRYPLELSMKNVPKVIRSLDFSFKPAYRVKKVHELAAHLIGSRGSRLPDDPPKTDADNIFFDITDTASSNINDCLSDNDIPGQRCVYPGMSLAKEKNVCLGNPLCDGIPLHFQYSDVVKITDSRIIIDGKPFSFFFAVENRAPALGKISETNDGKVKRKPGEKITIIAQGKDPDEDPLTYEMTGPSKDEFSLSINTNGYGVFSTDNNGLGPGSYEFTISAKDDEGLFDEEHFTLAVEP